MRSFDYSRLAQKAWDTDITVSNTKCVQAVRLYRKNGFAEMPADKKKFPFERANIAFEMKLEEIKP